MVIFLTNLSHGNGRLLPFRFHEKTNKREDIFMSGLKTYNILVIEDNTEHFEVLETILKKKVNLSIIVDRVKTKSEALKKALNNNYDLIICDIILQEDLDAGFEIADTVKKDNNTPLIILTRRVIQPFDRKIDTSIADAYINKPYNNGEIVHAIYRLLNENEPQLQELEVL
ncbi:MAG: response regulator [Candidatus Lokiarchaeota archaeon]|nr:response regulator [Candidatus Lokiarchaeota archaeon]